MVSLTLSKEFIRTLNAFEGKTPEQKVVNLVNGNIILKLRECEEEIIKFESKYGMTFADFEKACKKNKSPKMYSHEFERDFMEWEGYELEKKRWLATLKELKIHYLSKEQGWKV